MKDYLYFVDHYLYFRCDIAHLGNLNVTLYQPKLFYVLDFCAKGDICDIGYKTMVPNI
jgi:hypothetical protein